jgi:hypothetical protein
MLAPQLVDQPVARDDLVRAGQQKREHGALPRPAKRNEPVAVASLERPQDPEVHLRGT